VNDPVSRSIKTQTRFTSLAWGLASDAASEKYSSGLLVGGMSDGKLNVWDAAALLRGEGDDALITVIENHQTAVRSIAFNPLLQSLVAAASGDGNISIISLENPSAPVLTTCVIVTRSVLAQARAPTELTSLTLPLPLPRHRRYPRASLSP
jgi:protein transport protein SEC31